MGLWTPSVFSAILDGVTNLGPFRNPRTYLLGLAILSGAICLPASGRAASPEADAKAHYKKARALYQLGDFREALTEYKEAYTLKQDAAFLFNIAQCHRQLHEYPEAVRMYGNYLRDAPKAPNRAEVEELVQELKRAIEKEDGAKPAANPRAVSPAPATAVPPIPSAAAAPAPAAAPPAAVPAAPVPPVVAAPAAAPIPPAVIPPAVTPTPSSAAPKDEKISRWSIGAGAFVALGAPYALSKVSARITGPSGGTSYSEKLHLAAKSAGGIDLELAHAVAGSHTLALTFGRGWASVESDVTSLGVLRFDTSFYKLGVGYRYLFRRGALVRPTLGLLAGFVLHKIQGAAASKYDPSDPARPFADPEAGIMFDLRRFWLHLFARFDAVGAIGATIPMMTGGLVAGTGF